ncbi:RtcB family protein [Bradyrhizobium pachyrhizi]|uniref:RtcB family protein n=1 Tax=Bradyrhizobium pachyrhizi TaxID=280333 RepID=UPI0018F8C538|nr:RtcB family protein [Bradyrhizobium pachyrhizi]
MTGSDLISWGYSPGPWFKPALERANKLDANGCNEDTIRQALKGFAPEPVEMLTRRERAELGFNLNLEAETADEIANAAAVGEHMVELMRVPTIKAGAVMPDACPAGSAKGTIPVGGVVACENAIHPGYHSADICCSMAITVFDRSASPKAVLDAGMQVTHFGPGGRSDDAMSPTDDLLSQFANNRFLSPLIGAALHHFGTQGDGNHFFYVGRIKSTGEVALVTHHGSRKPGAMLYKAGMAVAERNTKRIAVGVPKHQAWIAADSEDGEEYWSALQLVRRWTRQNHFAIHNAVGKVIGARVSDRFWNEHNFVWQKPDGLFYHGKGATPAFPDFAADSNGLTLIPMNMAEPILITRGRNAPNGLGFAPHGAGRNMSRTAFKRELGDHLSEAELHRAAGLVDGIDARWFSGTPDTSEMPGGYKNAATVRRQIARFDLAEIVDEVLPYGCIMAGEIDWRRAGKELGESA